jgi:hypothetical protein
VSVYHSPRCRIDWTEVRSDGVVRDVVIPDRPLTLSFGLEFDLAIRGQASSFNLGFSLFTLGSYSGGGLWTGPLFQLPGSTGNIWVSKTWRVATDATPGIVVRGPLLYRPSASFLIPELTGDNEFAVAEEDHYIHVWENIF